MLVFTVHLTLHAIKLLLFIMLFLICYSPLTFALMWFVGELLIKCRKVLFQLPTKATILEKKPRLGIIKMLQVAAQD